jgi:aminoglycoside phosphotransferase (APT) family kinase protein
VHRFSDALPPDIRRWVESAAGEGARLIHCETLQGGITASVDLVVLDQRGQSVELVLKRSERGNTEDRQRATEREAGVLQLLEAAGLAAPRLVAANGSALLMTRLPGEVWLTPSDPRPWLGQMAATLAHLHAVQPPAGLLVRTLEVRPVSTPQDSRRPTLWQRVSEFLEHPAPAGSGLLHGDYQHFNLLWQREQLSGVVDWTWAGTGHPDRDVGHCCLNLAVLFSPEWARDFVTAYEAESGRATDPWWRAFQISRFGGDTWQEFIPVQVAGRAPVDPAGMTARVEDALLDLLP